LSPFVLELYYETNKKTRIQLVVPRKHFPNKFNGPARIKQKWQDGATTVEHMRPGQPTQLKVLLTLSYLHA
jgi:hypothetical protein